MSNHTTVSINPTKYKLRRCMSLLECRICKYAITLGQWYYDGGYSRRFHKGCAENCNVADTSK